MIREQDRKAWRKFKIQLAVIMAAALSATIYCNSSHAAQGKHFQIYDGQTDTICTYHENEFGHAESDDPTYMGTGVCWRKDMMDKADFHIRSKRK